jgi:DNA modification methylase
MGYGYHNIVNLTPANGVAESTLPANTHEIFHVFRKEKYFSHEEALPFCKTEGTLRATSVLNHGRPTTGDNYFKYAKPLFEMCYCLAYSRQKAIILDLFTGSGTTLIACEQLSRHCRGMELDERYCDVIVRRWVAWMEKAGEPWEVLLNGGDAGEKVERLMGQEG